MKITLGITTYARPDLLKMAATSLSLCKSIRNCNIRIYDDCSPHWNNKFLKKIFPSAKQIIRRTNNLGADGNMRQMFIDFLETGDDILVISDSDLIFRPDFITQIKSIMPHTDGIFSLYNSASHPPKKNVHIKKFKMIEKNTIGAAGTVMTREIVESIVQNVAKSRSYDWDWCCYIHKLNKRIFVCYESLVQHIGFDGTNCDNFLLEYGLNFYPQNSFNERITIECLQKVIASKNSLIKAYKIFKPLRFPAISLRIFRDKLLGKKFY